MKLFSLIVSVVTFMVTLFFLFSDFPDTSTFSGIIYLGLMLILLLICITGIIINKPIIVAKAKRKMFAKKQSRYRFS